LAIAVDGDEVFFSTRDCDVGSTKSYSLRGECPAGVQELFVDADSIYLIAEEPLGWRRTSAGLWRMPRAGGLANRIAVLPDFERIQGPGRTLFDGEAFYYMNLYGSVLRVSKRGGAPSRFLELDAMKAQGLAFVDDTALYVNCAGDLLRVPFDGTSPTTVSTASGDFATDAGHAYLATSTALFAAPLGGGTWQYVASLPESRYRASAVAGKLYLQDYRSVVVVDPGAERGRRLLELDDVVIGSLSVDSRGIFYTTSIDEGSGVWLLRSVQSQPQLLLDTARLAAAPAFDEKFAYLLQADGELHRHALLSEGASELLTPAGALEKLTSRPSPSERDRTSLAWEYDHDAELPRDLALDNSHVYWLDRALSSVFRNKKGTAEPELVAALPSRAAGFALDPDFVYVLRELDQRSEIVRLHKAPHTDAMILVQAKDYPPSFAVGSEGPVWTTSEQVFAFGRGGFRAYPALIDENRITSLTRHEDTLFFSYGGDSTSAEVIASQALGSSARRILALNTTAPRSLTPTVDALYFVETGFVASAKSRAKRVGCCAIWRAPR
jgi:hypothetical protein